MHLAQRSGIIDAIVNNSLQVHSVTVFSKILGKSRQYYPYDF